MLRIDNAKNHCGVKLRQIISNRQYPETVGFYTDRCYKFDITQDHLNDDGLTSIWLTNVFANAGDGRNVMRIITQVINKLVKERGWKLNVVASEIWFEYPIELDQLEDMMDVIIQELQQTVKPVE